MSNTISSKDGPFAETGNSKFETDKLVMYIHETSLYNKWANPDSISNLTTVMYMDSNFDQKLLAEQKLTDEWAREVLYMKFYIRNLGDQLTPFLENREKIEENRENIRLLRNFQCIERSVGLLIGWLHRMRDERKNPGAKKWKRGDEGTRGPHYVPRHSLSVESVVSAVPSRRMRTSKRTSNSSDRLTSNSDTGAVRPWKIPLFLLCPSQQEWRNGRGEELLFLLRALRAH
ncbi:hypothetical protein ALC56_14689 [Trachymyrmex septentrionalis]|uniref:Uncharacterized protein n=1 Tax=Trachymyrmex septentrionalis TaxID=34720 RepID=A0A195ESJ3_9HYME|nr:hypothetical protein ALC56_14689 [Trachymyrmex septentrionalis]